MSNQMYGYNPSYGGSGLSNVYPSRSIADPYLSDSSLMGSSRYLSSDSLSASDSSKYSLYLSQNDGLRYPGSDIGGMSGGFSGSRNSGGIGSAGMATATNQLLSHASWPGVDVTVAYDPVGAGAKRSTEAFYHQTVLGTHNTIGQSEALFSTNSLAKRPRFESATTLPIYPQRQGEKDCAHYMLTRTCKFGESCKFDHPIWVPEGGIPDWKEVPLSVTSETLPERPGEPDCPYFLKTQKCKFGFRCKFNHPKDTADPLGASETVDTSVLPERPTEAPCSFYMKTGKCKFGATCKFHHPKDIQIPSTGQENGDGGQIESAVGNDGTTGGDAMPAKQFVPFTPALLHNSKGLPIRLGEVDCPFYLKTGSCKYGATCRYNHPDRYGAINTSVAAALGQAVMPSPATNMNIGVMNPSASFFPTIDPRLAQTTMGSGPTIYPQRPGQIECDFYMKTGECKFGERCKFHHPIDRSATTPTMAKQALQQNVKLTLAGLPRREGSIICPFYMKTGTCKYGVTCRFDHPPPGEAIAMATVQGTQGATAASIEGEGEDNKETETVQEH